MNTHLALFAMVAINSLGTLALRQGASAAGPAVAAWALAGGGLYLVGAGIYLLLLSSAPLGALATVTSVASVCLMIAIGHRAYGESYSAVQIAGLVLGFAAVGLILGGR